MNKPYQEKTAGRNELMSRLSITLYISVVAIGNGTVESATAITVQ